MLIFNEFFNTLHSYSELNTLTSNKMLILHSSAPALLDLIEQFFMFKNSVCFFSSLQFKTTLFESVPKTYSSVVCSRKNEVSESQTDRKKNYAKAKH